MPDAVAKLVANAPRACALCPWRISNQGTPHPHGFYTVRNLDRLWNGLRTADAPGMTCHPTDPRMAEFSGYEATAEREETRECAGAIVLVVRELMRFQAICLADPDRKDALLAYRREQPKGLGRRAMADLVWRFIAGGTPVARAIQADSRLVNDPDVGYPKRLGEWDPEILVRAQAESPPRPVPQVAR